MIDQLKEKNIAIENLISALNNIDHQYLNMKYDRIVGGFQKPERLFNAELYHQLRKIQEDINVASELTKMKLHIELVKTPGIEVHPCIGDYRPRKISPDVVFHNSHNDTTNQLLVAEIKMEGASWVNIGKDFQKLLFYKLSRLQFKNAVFIYTGSKDALEEILFRFSNNFLRCLQDNEIIIVLPKMQQNEKYNWEAYNINLQNHE